jgi:formylglycine-generating enzyme required for sulfatase activity
LVGLDVAAGSHVLEIADVLVPVVVEQAGNHQVEVDLPADLPEGFVFVVGGDLKPAPTEPDGAAGELVAVRSFAVSELPTTFAQYLDFLASMPPEEAQEHVPRALGHGPLAHWQDGWRLDVSALFADEAPACSECLSVVGIGWDDAVAYCDWRSAVLGRVARLPREHEWERAALAGDGRRFPWGDSFEPGFANWRGAQPGPPRLQPVGSFPTDRSLFGVRDMAGGAAEWCLDLWQGHRDLRVVRGAHWATQPRVVAADRAGRHRDERSGAVGFRVVLELS